MDKVGDRFTNRQKQEVIDLFNSGKTAKEIGNIFNVARRTIGKLLKELGLQRSRSESSKLKIKSVLDDENIIERIKSLRNTHSIKQIAEELGSSISAVHRLCKKYDIGLPDNYSSQQASKMKESWTEEKRQIASKKAQSISDVVRQKLAISSKLLWQNTVYREKQIEIQKRYWNSEENKARLALYRSNQSRKVSSIQSILYSILDDLGVKYFREYADKPTDPECIIGPYNFDCVIPTNAKTLLIECHGDYWHSQEKAIRVDLAKSTYFERYLANDYDLKYLWEHEFACHEKVVETVKYWLGISKFELVDFAFDQIIVKTALAKEYIDILSKYNYLPNAGKGGKAFGAYIGDNLIAVCVFSNLPRQNIQIESFNPSRTKELSRLCIHPRYQKKNLASWFVSRCIKLLKDIDCVVSYCDTSFNHNGATYKAIGFKQDSIVRPDYWYCDNNGWVMHKKTLYAEKFGYKRIYGKEKKRYILEI